ncbi:hypothetical protein I5S53_02975 [Pseudomonas juntendi]|uniref:hypothetical protein n=1 Tax=Pseudomonas TaxID=286 RepID=UPI000D90A6B7|nr:MULTISPECIES: hypothetical protein [Pseudomonas]MBH3382938.1 hypothetical protein [Pseudomonas juntendi]PYC08937.1 hypothetical protein DMX12_03245 [Pseudomonas sp. MB-090624]WBM32785.1 hypothetical protein M2J80_25205 [Pseudomonas sp. NY11382]
MARPFFTSLLFCMTMALQASPTWAARTLVVTIYPHDELADVSDKQIDKDYVQPWLEEMRRISNHSIEVIFKRDVAGITDIPYRQMPPEDTHRVFSAAAHPQFRWQKSILLTRDSFGLNSEGAEHLGLAKLGYAHAIASMTSYGTLGHELGHLMNATHEAAELRYNPWPCETFVYPDRFSLRANCYRYSDQNRAAIANHLDHALRN